MKASSIVSALAVFICLIGGGHAACSFTAQDEATLNYALTLEHLEATFYRSLNNSALTSISQAAFAAAGYAPNVYNYLIMVGEHEAAHVAALTSTLTGAGCFAVAECSYNFDQAFASPTAFLTVARALESTGVSAYVGAFNKIYDPTLRQVAATIATIEARHTSFIATVLTNASTTGGQNPTNATDAPFPNVFDPARNTSEVFAIAGGFVNGTSTCAGINTSVVLTTIQSNYSGIINSGFQTPGPLPNGTCGISSGDLSTLNYALTLENLEAAFYAAALNSTVNASIPAAQAPYVQLVASHEQAHANFLRQTLNTYGCTPAPVCNYNFAAAFVNLSTFYATAVALEDTGVSAYDGAANTIRDSGFRQAAASIATVEGRHAAYFRILVNQTAPWDGAFDAAANANTVLNAVGATGFITGCPNGFTPSAPEFNTGGVSLAAPAVSTTVSQSTASQTTVSQTTGTSSSGSNSGSNTGSNTGSNSGNGAASVSASILLVLAAVAVAAF